jgi:hypothetical protein
VLWQQACKFGRGQFDDDFRQVEIFVIGAVVAGDCKTPQANWWGACLFPMMPITGLWDGETIRPTVGWVQDFFFAVIA